VNHSHLASLQQQLHKELNKRDPEEQQRILTYLIDDLQKQEQRSLVSEDYTVTDWERIKTYLSIPLIRWLYVLAIIIPVFSIIGFVYIALWVE